jgi:hypothetical protein
VTRRLLGIALALTALGGCRSKADQDRDAFTRGLDAYLAKRGVLCIGRQRWPVDVPEGAASRADAVQLPVLERLGLVTSTVLAERRNGVTTPFRLRRYRLTAAGRTHYVDRETREPASPDDPSAATRADLCVVELKLGQIKTREVQPPAATVSYTYAATAPPFTQDAGFRHAFPVVARLLAGTGSAELVEGFTLTPSGWTANELLPSQTPAGASAPQASAP